MTRNSLPTIDVYPWPDGLGFKGADEWWSYVRQQTESDKLDLLVTMALMSSSICERLLVHDQDLLRRLEFSSPTLERLSTIQATSIEEFAAALIGQDHDHTPGCHIGI